VALSAVLVFFGFSFTFVSEVIHQSKPFWLHLHIATATAWVILVIVQAALVMTRRLELHRRVGAYGFVLGSTAAVMATITALVLRHDSVVAHGANRRIERIAFLSIPLNTAVVFSVLLACAYVWRQRPPIHRRCMLLAAAVLTLPAAARIPVIGDMPNLLTDLLIAILCGVDIWRERSLHRVYWIGVPAVIAMQILTLWLSLSHPDWWVRAATLMIGV
jgi:uncharacterized membrane protein YozB (DUF420 family)